MRARAISAEGGTPDGARGGRAHHGLERGQHALLALCRLRTLSSHGRDDDDDDNGVRRRRALVRTAPLSASNGRPAHATCPPARRRGECATCHSIAIFASFFRYFSQLDQTNFSRFRRTLSTGFDCWLCYFRYLRSSSNTNARAAEQLLWSASGTLWAIFQSRNDDL